MAIDQHRHSGAIEDYAKAIYKGVELTADGERVALEALRHHRLLELYLSEHLGVP